MPAPRKAPALCALILSCSTPRPAPVASAPEALPTLDGRPVYGRALDPTATAYFELARLQRGDVAPLPPPDAGADALRQGFAPWLRRRADALRELASMIPALDRRSPDDAVFAAVLYATVAEELRDAVRALPPPPGLAQDAVIYWRETRDAQVAPLARHARDAWNRCASALPRASTPLQAWAPVCAARSRALEAAIAQADAAPARVERPAPQRVVIPSECEGPELHATTPDPDAPPPNDRAPREIAVLYRDERLQGAERARLLNAVRAWVARLPGARIVPQAEVDAAAFLHAQRRWRVGGPVCGQPPPIPALLAARHPNLVVASVSTWCADVDDDAPDAGDRTRCTLSVDFDRAGTDDRGGLPPYRAVDLQGAPSDAASWVNAASRLGDPDAGTAMAGILGGVLGGEAGVFRLLGHADIDPWLRVVPTLEGWGRDAPRRALTACATRTGGVGSYRLGWTISPNGIAQDVTVTPITPPTDGSAERVAACVREALSRVAFPCPRAEAPVPVTARLCLGWM